MIYIPDTHTQKINSPVRSILAKVELLNSSSTNVNTFKYNDSLVINTSPNIRVEEYLPFKEDSKIVKLEDSSLKLSDNLPIVDGAAAVFPVYSESLPSFRRLAVH